MGTRTRRRGDLNAVSDIDEIDGLLVTRIRRPHMTWRWCGGVRWLGWIPGRRKRVSRIARWGDLPGIATI